jgi:choline kinase
MKAVIVAAGKGERLGPIAKSLPKCLLSIGNKSLITRSVECLLSNDIKEIFIVVGFRKEKIENHIKNKARYIVNQDFSDNNNMASLWFSRQYVYGASFLYLHSDLLYHPEIIDKCLKYKESTVLMVDKIKCSAEEMKVRVNNGLLIKSDKDIPPDEAYGEWLGISKFSKEVSKELFNEIDLILQEKKYKVYDTFALTRIAEKGIEIPVCDIGGLPWIEIDTADDLKRAENIIYPLIRKSGYG